MKPNKKKIVYRCAEKDCLTKCEVSDLDIYIEQPEPMYCPYRGELCKFKKVK